MPIFDSDILIHCERGNREAMVWLDQAEERKISCITAMELLQGARSSRELKHTQNFLSEFEFEILPVTENIGHRASMYIEEYALGSGLRLADALIAATAMERHLPLVTGNARHFKAISGLQVKTFKT